MLKGGFNTMGHRQSKRGRRLIARVSVILLGAMPLLPLSSFASPSAATRGNLLGADGRTPGVNLEQAQVSPSAGAPSASKAATSQGSLERKSPTTTRPVGMKVPPIKVVTPIKEAYLSGSGEHILLLLHIPRDRGPAYVEVYNKTKVEISLFRFTLSALGHEGELDFEGLPAGWSAVKMVSIQSPRELAVQSPRAIDKEANEISPPLVIHQTPLVGSSMRTGLRKPGA